METLTHKPEGTENSAPTWGIAEMAADFEITPRAIRFYEDKGLIAPLRRGGARIYTQADRKRMEQILLGKRLGFTLEDIRAVQEVADGEINDAMELHRRKENFEFVIKKLRRQRRDIETLTRQMQDLCAAIDNHIENAPAQTDAFAFPEADAYHAKLTQHMEDDFLPL